MFEGRMAAMKLLLHLQRGGCFREGNGWSYQYCRRQWSLVDAEHLRYKFLNAWDAALQALDSHHAFLSSTHQIVSYASDSEQASSPSGTPFFGCWYLCLCACCCELWGWLRLLICHAADCGRTWPSGVCLQLLALQ